MGQMAINLAYQAFAKFERDRVSRFAQWDYLVNGP
jgi:hypothetical protein